MITKWKLFNFKSVRDETDLELAPLTIFAGSNSSGKSTVLQSMLLIAQTLSSRATTRPIVLNGELVHLGQFDDIRSFAGEADQISIGWEIRDNHPDHPYRTAMISRRDPWQTTEADWIPDLVRVRCQVAFDVDMASAQRQRQQLQPRLYSVVIDNTERAWRFGSDGTSIGVEVHEEKDTELSVFLAPPDTVGRRQRLLADSTPAGAAGALAYDIRLSGDSNLKSEISQQEPTLPQPIVGAHMEHFLPVEYFTLKDVISDRLQRFLNILWDSSNSAFDLLLWLKFEGNDRTFESLGELVGLAKAVDQFRLDFSDFKYSHLSGDYDPEDPPEYLEEGSEEAIAAMAQLQSLAEQLLERHPLVVSRLRDKEVVQKLLLDRYLRRVNEAQRDSSDEMEIVRRPLSSNLVASAIFVQTTFTQLLRYLGPLRDAPKPVYSSFTALAPTDVGLRGENTAAVLELNKDLQIKYMPPKVFDADVKETRSLVRTLQSAINEWLQYLGVAESVETHDMGKFGHQMQVVADPTARAADLTHVGVGVSQVLPILVMCLLAEPDTTIILEQPELHLHPRVQARLADFLFATTQMGVQCIVETHSEHMINRLRLRIASAPATRRIGDTVKVYFVEKKDGCSRFRDVVINDYGAILEWPEGFFDQSQLEAEEILRAGLAKRQAARRRRDDSAS